MSRDSTPMIGQIPYPGAAGMAGLGGFWSTVAKVAVLPLTVTAKSITAPMAASGIPYAKAADRIVSRATLEPVNKSIDFVTDKATDAACTLLMNKYFQVGATAVITVYTSGAGLVAAQGGKVVATGMCAKRIADELASRQAADTSKKLAALQQGTAADAILNPNSFPTGSITYKQPDGMYRVAIPKGIGDVGAITHVEVAILSSKPDVIEVDKPTYAKATKPFYLQTSFLIGAGVVAALAIGGVSFAAYKKRRKK